MSERLPDLLTGEYHAVNQQRREVFGMSAPADMSLSERRLWNVNPEDHNWRSQYLQNMPDYLAGYFADRYSKIFSANNGRRRANAFLRQTIGQNVLPRLQLVRSRYRLDEAAQHELPFIKQLDRLPTLDRQDVRDLAYKVASYLSLSLAEFVDKTSMPQEPDEQTITCIAYRYVAELAALTGTQPPYWAEFKACKGELSLRKAQSGLLRMMAPEWWRGRLKQMRDLQREHMAIAVGQVQKSASPYVSRGTLAEWVEQKKRNREFFKRYDLMNKETGDRVAMDEMVNRSTANPAMRRRELMTRMRGFEDIANETGCVGDFYTITAPSRYHSVYSQGGFITKWNGSSPRDTQRYLCRVWARIRAALSREEIHVFGFRVVEPHHDGTPHWHMLLFMLPEHRERVQQIMREHASKEDADELNTPQARKARFHAEPIDPTKGSATGYIAKYISKNIDGFAMDGEKDDETGSNMRDMAKAVCAWASRWRIRQFQQIGGAPVTVWRELRRLGDTRLPNEKMDAVLASASVASCWASYTMAQGGPLVARDDLVIRLCYEITEMGNEYAEDVQRVQGIYSPHYQDSEVFTRLVKWEAVAKLADASAEAGPSGGIAAPWSSVNNCTGPERRRLELELKARGFEGHEEEISLLSRGCSINSGARMRLFYRNGRLQEQKITI
ncbi:replication endonuclease [Pantoea sp. PNT02]|uniref:replication endonuclease n=1 Tax=Pantoea sp. PNT02 TaxID=2769261 RepID=UPI00178178E7|nr:replication endonuclease [Pantoea sp. PNT02]MBD9643664.1 replication endonuclease [Pantoea sp. PNT02]